MTTNDKLMDVAPTPADVRAHVATQRRRLGLTSYAKAMSRAVANAREEGTEVTLVHEVWRKWEKGDGPLSANLVAAIAWAFGWDHNWPATLPPAVPFRRYDELADRYEQLAQAHRAMALIVRQLGELQGVDVSALRDVD